MKKLCKCGCGHEVGGHWDHGDHGKFIKSDYLIGHNRRGYKATEETKRKLSESHKGRPSTYKGKTASPELREKLRIAHLGQRPAMYGCKHSLESIEKMRSIKIGKKMSEEAKINMSRSQRAKWEDPNHAKKMITAWRFKPNKKEVKLMDFLDSAYPGEWKFVGDGQLIISGKCPDFVNCNGQKKIIELFGDYWHNGKDPEDRIKIFKPFGYSTLVIWERELKDMNLLAAKIGDFVNEGV